MNMHLVMVRLASTGLLTLLCLAFTPSWAEPENLGTDNPLPENLLEAPPIDIDTEVEQEAEAPPAAPLPLEDLRTFAKIFGRIKSDYVEDVDDTSLLENAIRGMLAGLDPHSSYLGPEAFGDLQENTMGEFGGLGIEVGMENGFIKVISPIDDTPAQKAGIQAQDLIIKLDDQPVKGLSLSKAVELMRGEVGTPIVLTIIREGEPQPLTISVIRDRIKVTSVRQRSLEPGFGYIRINQFQVQTGADLTDAIDKLKMENEPLKGVILDLRNNPGGVLDAAVDVSNTFLSEGLIVYTEGRTSSGQMKFHATSSTPLATVPMVVLINSGSASASEIVAGALQDHRRAIILGTESFGKGSVQTIFQLDETHALKLTTARYYTPSGRSIQAEGIQPDIIVEQGTVTTEKDSPFYKEENLPRHLSNGNGNDDGESEDATETRPEEDGLKETPAVAIKDYQLNEALNILKGINILTLAAKTSLPSKTSLPHQAGGLEDDLADEPLATPTEDDAF